MKMRHFFLPFEPAYEGIFESAAQWTWPVQCEGCHDVIFTAGVYFTQRGTHSRTFDLETTNGAATLNSLCRSWIVRRRGFQNGQRSLKMIRLTLLNELSHISQHGQTTNSQQVDFHQPQCFH